MCFGVEVRVYFLEVGMGVFFYSGRRVSGKGEVGNRNFLRRVDVSFRREDR